MKFQIRTFLEPKGLESVYNSEFEIKFSKLI